MRGAAVDLDFIVEPLPCSFVPRPEKMAKGKPAGIRAGRKLRIHRRSQRWASKVRLSGSLYVAYGSVHVYIREKTGEVAPEVTPTHQSDHASNVAFTCLTMTTRNGTVRGEYVNVNRHLQQVTSTND